MKKLFSILSVAALAIGLMAFAIPSALALAPAGSMTSPDLTVKIGELKATNTITITDTNPAEITAANDIKIKIPAAVHAIWDTTVTTITPGGAAAAKIDAAVTYTGTDTVNITVNTNFANSDVVTIAGLKLIGTATTSTVATLQYAIDGSTFGAGTGTTNVTVAAADDLTSVIATPVDPVKGATTNYTFNFVIPAGGVIPKDGKIVITLPAGFTTTGATFVSSTGIDGGFTVTTTTPAFTLTRDGVGTNTGAGAKTIVVSGIVNHATAATTYTATVATQTAAAAALESGTSATFTVSAAPAAITDLTCEASGQAGAVWLRWTTPAGATAGYTVKYDLAAIDDDTKFGNAAAYTQTWTNDARGASSQQLLEGLNPGTTYWFSVKSKGFGATTSLISNATATCKAPSSASSAVHDTTGPTVQITSPASGSTVQSGQPLVIKGTAIDVGGSSVQKVEVSLDGGSTWNIASVVSDDGTNVLWQYNWSLAQAGTRTIMVRATDWVNNVETNGPSITFTVSATAPTTPVTTTPTITAPAGLTGIQAQIYTLQVQLVSLLQQLLAMLLAAR